MIDNGKYLKSHNISFTEKRWYERLLDFFRVIPNEATTFVTVAISLWGLAEVVMEVSNNRVPIRDFAIPVLLISFVVATYRAYSSYKSYVPEALLSESKATQSIYRKQQCGWQLALAKQMLAERIEDSEATLNRIERGAAFINPKRIGSEEYLEWLQSRPETLERLVHSVAVLCTSELPEIIGKTTSEAQLSQLRIEIDALATLYEYAKDFEIECHEIVPPESFGDVHEMTHGWTNPIRKGVGRFNEILHELSSIDRNALRAGNVTPPNFNISFDSPENIDEFCRRLENIDGAAMFES